MERLSLICGWRHIRQLWLISGWSALSILLLIPMSPSLRWVVLLCLFVALSSFDFLLRAREILEEVDSEPKE
jgi:hypothetical protein